MISFERFQMDDNTPIYLQIVQYLKRGMVGSVVEDGDELPSRRVLSALLGVNPNTVQKACRMLEEEGLIESRAGAKSYVALTEEKQNKLRAELLREDVKALVKTLKDTGLTRENALQIISEMWEAAP